MTITRRAASQRRSYKSKTEDLRAVVFTFMPLAERLCRQVRPPADLRLQSSHDLTYQKLFIEHVRSVCLAAVHMLSGLEWGLVLPKSPAGCLENY